jgi:hypothetical protein
MFRPAFASPIARMFWTFWQGWLMFAGIQAVLRGYIAGCRLAHYLRLREG